MTTFDQVNICTVVHYLASSLLLCASFFTPATSSLSTTYSSDSHLAQLLQPCIDAPRRSGGEKMWSRFMTHKIKTLSPIMGESQGSCRSLGHIFIHHRWPLFKSSFSKLPHHCRCLPPPSPSTWNQDIEPPPSFPWCSPHCSPTTTQVWRGNVVTICDSQSKNALTKNKGESHGNCW